MSEGLSAVGVRSLQFTLFVHSVQLAFLHFSSPYYFGWDTVTGRRVIIFFRKVLLKIQIFSFAFYSAINPCIYALFSKDFRFAFKKIICRCICQREKKPPPQIVPIFLSSLGEDSEGNNELEHGSDSR